MTYRDADKTRVLFLTPTPDFVGGAEKSLLDLLANPDVEAVLAAPGEGPLVERARALGAQTWSFPLGTVGQVTRPPRLSILLKASADGLKAAKRIRHIARESGAQMVHSNGLKVHVLACMARLLGGPPVVVHIRDVPFTPAEKLVWRFLATVATRMFVVSRACWPWERLPANIKVVHNGVATSEAPLPPKPLSGPLTIGFVGRLHPFKGLHLLVDWLDEGRKRGLDLRLVVRGKARDGEEAYVEAVEKTVADRHLEPYCRFEGQQSGLDAIYGGLDIVAVPSSVPDPFPRAVMESLSLGIPVVGYPAGGIPDMIRHRETGYMVTSADTFVAAVADLTESQASYDRIRKAGYNWVRNALSLDVLHATVNSQYAEIKHGIKQPTKQPTP